MARAQLDKDPAQVAAMFDEVARGYDRANAVMTFGLDRRWRHRAAAVLDTTDGDRVLDLAAGTGVSSAEFARHGAWCVAADFSEGMLQAGAHRGVPMVAADGLRLPFADASFDAATVLFGLRNMVDPERALGELLRVTKPAGRLLICEVSTPPNRVIRFLHRKFLMPGLTWLGKRTSSNPDAYAYLAESTAAWPAQRALGEMIARAGWTGVEWRNVTFGVVAIHRARKPEPGD